MPLGRSAVGYLRRSTERQERSIADQRSAIEQYCRNHDLSLVGFYIDDAVSGVSTAGRRAFQQLIRDSQRRTCDFGHVVIYDVKRFGRVDNDEAGYYRYLLRSRGVEVRYVSENFTGDGTDDLLRSVKLWQAREESRDLAKVSIRGLLSKVRTGCWMGGAPPYAFDLRYETQSGQFLVRVRYNRDGSKLALDDAGTPVRRLERRETIAVSRCDRCHLVPGDAARVEVVQRIFRMYTEQGFGVQRIAETLNQDRVPTARDRGWASHYRERWTAAVVAAILSHPAYCGDMVWNRRTDARFFRIENGTAVQRSRIGARRLETNQREAWFVVKDTHPAIVSRWTWSVAQQRLAAQARSPLRRGDYPASDLEGCGATRRFPSLTASRSRFLLSGLCMCACCGARYAGWRETYACRRRLQHGRRSCAARSVAKGPLENRVVEAVLDYLARYHGPEGQRQLAEAVQLSASHIRAALDTPGTVDLCPSEFDVEQIGLETSRFLEGLGYALRSGAAVERFSAIRRCVRRIVVDGEHAIAQMEVLLVPSLSARVANSPAVRLELEVEPCS